MSNRIIIIDDDRDYVALMTDKLRAIGFDDLYPVDSADIIEQ